MNHLLAFLEENVKTEERFTAEFIIQNFLGSVDREHYYRGIDVYSLADRNDAVLTIYHGHEETYGDSASLELYRLPFATRTEFDLLKIVKNKLENMIY